LLVAAFLSRKTALTYRIIEFAPAVTLGRERDRHRSTDAFEPSDGHTGHLRRRPRAEGPLRIADPLGLADRVGARALEPARVLGSRPRRLPRLWTEPQAITTCPTTCAHHTFIVAAFRREQRRSSMVAAG
jgi:hypothetical protein